jgi:hypothetical protein
VCGCAAAAAQNYVAAQTLPIYVASRGLT